MPRKIICAFEVSLTTPAQNTHYVLNVLVEFLPDTDELGHVPYQKNVMNVISPPEIATYRQELGLNMCFFGIQWEKEKSLYWIGTCRAGLQQTPNLSPVRNTAPTKAGIVQGSGFNGQG